MNDPNSTRPQGTLGPILSEQAEALRRQAEIDLEVTMREHRYELDQILHRQKAVLRTLILTLIAFIGAAVLLFAWLRHNETAELEQRRIEADREVDGLRKRNEEAQALIESFRELERAWKRRLLEAAGSRPADELPPDALPADSAAAPGNSGGSASGAPAAAPVYGPLPEPAPPKAVKP